MVKRDGLPFKPGQKLPMEAAEGLGTAIPVDKLKPVTANEIKVMEKKQVEAATAAIETIPTPEKAESTEPVGDQEKFVLRSQALSKLSPEEREALGLADNVRRCQRCGHDLSKRVTEDPSPEDKHDFLRTLYTGDRFTKSYSLFNGMVKVWFRARITSEGDDVIRQMHQDADIHRHDPALIQVRMTRLNMVCGLARMEWYNEKGEMTNVVEYPEVDVKNYPPDKDIERTCVALADEKILQPLNEALYNAMFHVFMKFSILVETLFARAEDSDFWQATK